MLGFKCFLVPQTHEFNHCRKRSYDLVSGKNKLQDKIQSDMNAFLESCKKTENEANNALKMVDLQNPEFVSFRAFHKTLQDRLSIMVCVINSTWPCSGSGTMDLIKCDALPELPPALKGSQSTEIIERFWKLKCAAVKKDKDMCEHLIKEVQGREKEYAMLDQSLLNLDKVSDNWWPNDLADACVSLVLCMNLAQSCASLDVTPDMNHVKPFNAFKLQLHVALNRCQTEDDVKTAMSILKDVIQKLQSVRNSVNRATSDLARAMAAKQRRSETEKKAQEKKAEQEAANKAKEIVDAQKKGAGANDKVSCLMLQDVFTGALKQAIQAFETEEEFQKAKDDEGRPYIVRKAQAWVDLCENTADFKGLMEVFQAQFPASPACSNSGGTLPGANQDSFRPNLRQGDGHLGGLLACVG